MAEAQVRQVWQGLADAGIEAFTGASVRPHVTLAHGLELELDPPVTALAGHPQFERVFPGLGLFAEPGVLYLSTIMTDALWTLHREVARLRQSMADARAPTTGLSAGRRTAPSRST